MPDNIEVAKSKDQQRLRRQHLANAIDFLREAFAALDQAEAELRDIQRQDECPEYGARFLFPGEQPGVVMHQITTSEATTIVGALVAYFEERIL